ncbi:MAG: hypothetical protein ACI4RP_07645 [Acutalibacteraceae bacterium]
MWELNEITAEELETLPPDEYEKRFEENTLIVKLLEYSNISVDIDETVLEPNTHKLSPSLVRLLSKKNVTIKEHRYIFEFWDKTKNRNEWTRYTVKVPIKTYESGIFKRIMDGDEFYRHGISILHMLAKDDAVADKAKMAIGVAVYLLELSGTEEQTFFFDTVKILEYQKRLKHIMCQPCFPNSFIWPEYPKENENAEKAKKAIEAFNKQTKNSDNTGVE